MRKKVFLFVWILAILSFAGAVLAKGGNPGAGGFKLHGYLMGIDGMRLTADRPNPNEGGETVLRELRLRLEADWNSPDGNTYFLMKCDGIKDFITGQIDKDLREAYLGHTMGPLDARIGRQIITWGVGDVFFINEVFPKDWESYFLGRPMDYLKMGVDALKMRYSGKEIGIEALMIPSFEPDHFPSGLRFHSYNPFAAIPDRREEKPDRTPTNNEYVLRLSKRFGGYDFAFYAYRGFWRTPAPQLDNPLAPMRVTWFYPRLDTFGLSAQGAALGGIISFETGYYDSLKDKAGSDPLFPNSEWRFLTNYQRDLGNELSVSIQLYGDLMAGYSDYQDSLPVGSPKKKRFRSFFSNRFTKWLNYHAWMLSLFTAYGIAENDYYIKPEIVYKSSDKLSYFLNANVFGGEKTTTFFGQFQKNDNVSFGIRMDY